MPRVSLIPGPARSRRRQVVAWVSALALVGLVMGALITATVTTRYVSRVSVHVTPLPGNAFASRSGATLAAMTTEAQLPTSDAVLERVASTSGSASVAGLRSRISTSVPPETEVVVITVRGSSENQARTVADKVAAATLAERAKLATATSAAQVTELRALVAEAEGDLTTAMREGRSTAEVNVLSRRLANLGRQLSAVSVGPPNPGAVTAVSTSLDPSSVRKTALGAVLGAGLGAVVGLWVGRGGARSRVRRRRWRLR